jgi:hypothetical protein
VVGRVSALQSAPGNVLIDGALEVYSTRLSRIAGLVDGIGLIDEMKPGNFRPVSTTSAAD